MVRAIWAPERRVAKMGLVGSDMRKKGQKDCLHLGRPGERA